MRTEFLSSNASGMLEVDLRETIPTSSWLSSPRQHCPYSEKRGIHQLTCKREAKPSTAPLSATRWKAEISKTDNGEIDDSEREPGNQTARDRTCGIHQLNGGIVESVFLHHSLFRKKRWRACSTVTCALKETHNGNCCDIFSHGGFVVANIWCC
jgi:hypothetical protein